MSALTRQRERIHFAVFRIGLGLYLCALFAWLIPYGAELYSREGMIPDAAWNTTAPIAPELLGGWDSPSALRALLAVAAVLALPLALGFQRRLAAALLWTIFLALFLRNNFTRHVATDYIGWMLLLCAVVPATEGRFPWRRAERERGEPGDPGLLRAAHLAAWGLAAFTYSLSGWLKLGNPLWRDGSALSLILTHPLADPGGVTQALLAVPGLLTLATWLALGAELLCLPLALWRWSRAAVWAVLTSMHLGIALLLNLGEIPVALLLFHGLLFDVRWLELRPRRAGAETVPEAEAAA